MKYGVTLTGAGPMADREKLRRGARKADKLGFQSLWLWDHVAFPGKLPESYGRSYFSPETHFFAPIPTLAFLAAETKRIKLGTGVLLLALRHPLLVAKDVATLDVLSEGRVIFGVGLGWLAEEFEALGIPFRERAGRVRESVGILRRLWTAGRLQEEGRYYRFPESTSYPLPVQRGGPPIWFGGSAEPALKRAVELGDGWLGVGGPIESLSRRVAKVVQFAREAKKPDFAIGVVVSPEITNEEVDQLRQIGVTHMNLSFPAGEAEEIEARMEAAARRLLTS